MDTESDIETIEKTQKYKDIETIEKTQKYKFCIIKTILKSRSKSDKHQIKSNMKIKSLQTCASF